jgi:hypothetical protein
VPDYVPAVQFPRFSVCFAVSLFLLGSGMAHAQVTAGASPGLNAALVRLFGGHTGFTAHLELRMLDANTNETLNAPMQFALLDGKMRGELDIAKLKSKDLPAMAASAAKSVGMERVITLVRPDKQESYLLYPAFQACVVAPLDADEVAALQKPARIKRTALGKETIDGQPCQKQRVVVTEPDGRQHTATIWVSPALKNFPVRVETRDGTDTILMQFRQVKLQRPDATLFDLPTGTARYDDPKELTTAVMKKLLSQALGAGK